MFSWVVSASGIPLPSDGGQLDVTSYGAVANDGNDDTAAIQSAFNAMAATQIVYFPAGTYHINNTLFVYNTSTRAHQNHITMMGESESATIIQLLNSTSGFTSAATPKPMIQTKSGNNVFGQWMRDLTVNTGTGNCGAIGVDWITSNRGGLDGVTIKSGARNKCGVLGIDLRRQWPGPMTLTNIRVEGFDKALETFTDEYGIAIDGMDILNQLVVGIDIHAHTVAIKGLWSRNTVPGLRVRHRNAAVAIVDSDFTNGVSGNAAIDRDAGVLYIRDVTQTGYGYILDNAGTLITGSSLAEWWSKTEVTGFSTEAGALNLPFTTMAPIAYPAVANWINVADYGAVPGDTNDDAAAIQDAIDDAASQGKTTVYIPNGDYRINTTLDIHGSVQRLIGLTARLRLNGALATSNGPFFSMSATGSKVVFEHLILDRVSGTADYTVINHNNNSWVVFLHGAAGAGPAKYVSTGGSSKVRTIDFNMGFDISGVASAWAVGWNREGDPVNASDSHAKVADGATFSALLYKSEGDTVQAHALDGGEIEILGHLHKWRNGSPVVAAEFVNENGLMSIACSRWLHDTWVQEIIGGVTTNLQPAAPKQEALYIGW